MPLVDFNTFWWRCNVCFWTVYKNGTYQASVTFWTVMRFHSIWFWYFSHKSWKTNYVWRGCGNNKNFYVSKDKLTDRIHLSKHKFTFQEEKLKQFKPTKMASLLSPVITASSLNVIMNRRTAIKHILWVLVRTATIYLSRNKAKAIQPDHDDFSSFICKKNMFLKCDYEQKNRY